MRRTTRKISGPALGRYLRRFFADEPGLPVETAEHLALRARATFSSIRVRATAVAIAGEKGVAERSAAALKSAVARPAAVPLARSSTPLPAIATTPQPAATVEAAKSPAAQPEAAAAFDAYAIGLVPTFQREGRDGLIGKLSEITSADNLRKMARAQQIVLPETMRQADVTLDELRAAIADSVAKRVADRKAAAR